MSTTKITPSFLLRGVSPISTGARFKTKFHTKSVEEVISSLCKVPITKVNIIDTNSKAFQAPKLYVAPELHFETSGNRDFHIFDSTGGHPVQGGICDYCKREFKTLALGYPIKMEEKIALVSGQRRSITIFWTEGCFDDYRCVYSRIWEYLRYPVNKSPLDFATAERLLKLMFAKEYPEKRLTRYSDASLLKCNGGSVSDEDWSNGQYCYTRDESIMTIPVKTSYLRTKFGTEDVSLPTKTDPVQYTSTTYTG